MKTTSLFLYLACSITGLALSSTVSAQTETVQLATAFAVELCTMNNNTSTCQPAPGSIDGSNVTIELSSCNDNGNGGTLCAGAWTGSVAVEGVTYVGTVAVEHDSDNGYSFVAALGNDPMTSAAIDHNSTGTITDVIANVGQTTNSTQVSGETIYPVVAFTAPMSSVHKSLIGNFHPHIIKK